MLNATVQTNQPYQKSIFANGLTSMGSAGLAVAQGMKRGREMTTPGKFSGDGVRRNGTKRSQFTLPVTGGLDLTPGVKVDGNLLFTITGPDSVAYAIDPYVDGDQLRIGRTAITNPSHAGIDIVSIQRLLRMFAGEPEPNDDWEPLSTSEILAGCQVFGPHISSTVDEELHRVSNRHRIDSRKVNAGLWNSTMWVNVWGAVALGETCGLILRREDAVDLDAEDLRQFVDDALGTAVKFAPQERTTTQPFTLVPWHGYGSPPISELVYEEKDGVGGSKRKVGLFLVCGICEYTNPGSSTKYREALTNIRTAMFVGLIHLVGLKPMFTF